MENKKPKRLSIKEMLDKEVEISASMKQLIENYNNAEKLAANPNEEIKRKKKSFENKEDTPSIIEETPSAITNILDNMERKAKLSSIELDSSDDDMLSEVEVKEIQDEKQIEPKKVVLNIEQLLETIDIEKQYTKYIKDKDNKIAYSVTPLFNTLQQLVINSKNSNYALQLLQKNYPGLDSHALREIIVKGNNADENLLAAYVNVSDGVSVHAQVILDSQDVNLNMKYSKLFGADIAAHGQIVVQYGQPNDILEYVEMHKSQPAISSNMKMYSDAIIKSGDVKSNIEFARLPGANVQAHGKVVWMYGSLNENIEMADIPGADIKLHEDKIFSQGDEDAWLDFSYIFGANLDKLGAKILASKNPEVCFLFANVHCDRMNNIRDFGLVVQEYGDAGVNHDFAFIPGADLEAHGLAVIERGSDKQIADFVALYPVADITPYQERIIASSDNKVKIHFARKVFGANIAALAESVAASGDIDSLAEFSYIPGANKSEIMTIVHELKFGHKNRENLTNTEFELL